MQKVLLIIALLLSTASIASEFNNRVFSGKAFCNFQVWKLNGQVYSRIIYEDLKLDINESEEMGDFKDFTTPQSVYRVAMTHYEWNADKIHLSVLSDKNTGNFLRNTSMKVNKQAWNNSFFMESQIDSMTRVNLNCSPLSL